MPSNAKFVLPYLENKTYYKFRHTESHRIHIMEMQPSVVTPGGSCTAEVEFEFEFSNWVLPKTTANFRFSSGWPSFLLFVYVCKWVEWKKPPPIAVSAVATTGDHHLGSGPELKLRWWTQTLSRLNKKHRSRSLSFEHATRLKDSGDTHKCQSSFPEIQFLTFCQNLTD